MAVIILSEELMQDVTLFEIVLDAFDSIEDITDHYDRYYKRHRLRVQHEEVPKEDKIIDLILYQFEGVRPFVIEYGIY